MESSEPTEHAESPAELDSAPASASAIPAGNSVPPDSETPFSVSESTMDEEFKSLCLRVEFVGSHDVVSERREGGGASHAGVDVQQQVSAEGGVYQSVCSESVLWKRRKMLRRRLRRCGRREGTAMGEDLV